MQRMRYRTRREEQWRGRGAITRIAGAVTLTAALGVIGFLAASSVAGSATQNQPRPDPGERKRPHPLPVRQGQKRQKLL